jgi:hypothetical protein
MTNAADIVERYFTAFYTGDGQTARHYLRDDNFSLTGPICEDHCQADRWEAGRWSCVVAGV